jgi:hypothetical protein
LNRAADFSICVPATRSLNRPSILDDNLHADARHESIAPPVLGSKIRSDMLRKFLAPGPRNQIIDSRVRQRADPGMARRLGRGAHRHRHRAVLRA